MAAGSPLMPPDAPDTETRHASATGTPCAAGAETRTAAGAETRTASCDAPHIAVIIPAFDKWDLTRACLSSLDEHRPGCPFEVIVVDNGSTDETREALLPFGIALFGAAFQRVRFETNAHFGPGCNAGARQAAAPFLFFLNNDTLLTPGWGPPLLRAFENDSSLGAAGPLLLYEDGTVQHLGIFFGLPGIGHLYKGFRRDHPVVSRRRALQAITAAAMLVPSSLFRSLGGFYEEYRNGYEDVDFCLRLRQQGKTVACVAESVIIHLEGRTPGRNSHEGRNAALLARRCGDLYAPDKHILGLKDGFRPFVTDAWSLGLALRPKDDLELKRIAAAGSLEERYSLTRAHPFWPGGRLSLGAALIERGEVRTGLRLLLEAAEILDSAPAYATLANAALASGDQALHEAALAAGRDLDASRRDRGLGMQCRRKALRFSDKLLEQLFDEKLRETPA